MKPSNFIREVSLCSGWKLMQKLKTGQNKESKLWWHTWPQMGYVYIIPFTRCHQSRDRKIGRTRSQKSGEKQYLLDMIGPLDLFIHSNYGCLHMANTQSSKSILQWGLGRGTLNPVLAEKILTVSVFDREGKSISFKDFAPVKSTMLWEGWFQIHKYRVAQTGGLLRNKSICSNCYVGVCLDGVCTFQGRGVWIINARQIEQRCKWNTKT